MQGTIRPQAVRRVSADVAVPLAWAKIHARRVSRRRNYTRNHFDFSFDYMLKCIGSLHFQEPVV
jgi:hypothetical protein